MNRNDLHIKFTESILVNNDTNFYCIRIILESLSIKLNNFDNKYENLKIHLEINSNGIDYHIIEEDVEIYCSKYAMYCFIERLEKEIFPSVDICKYVKSYFYTKDFDGWNTNKKVIDWYTFEQERHKFINPREVWDCKLWINVWSEANWKWKYMRPVLVISRVWSSFLVLPLTKHWKKEWERYSEFYYELKNYFNKDSFVMLSQLKTIDKRRCIKNLKTINEEDFNNIVSLTKELYFPSTEEHENNGTN